MAKLLSSREAASVIGTHLVQVREWTRRLDDPLPTVPVGKTGKFRKIIADEIPAWLAREAGRHRPQTTRR